MFLSFVSLGVCLVTASSSTARRPRLPTLNLVHFGQAWPSHLGGVLGRPLSLARPPSTTKAVRTPPPESYGAKSATSKSTGRDPIVSINFRSRMAVTRNRKYPPSHANKHTRYGTMYMYSYSYAHAPGPFPRFLLLRFLIGLSRPKYHHHH